MEPNRSQPKPRRRRPATGRRSAAPSAAAPSVAAVRAAVAAAAALLTAVMAAQAQLPPPPEPAGNPLTASKANLGKVLFWDEQISSTRTVACGTCHLPTSGGEDPRSGVSPLAVHPGPDGLFGGADDVFGSPGVPLNQSSGLYDWSTHFGLTEQVTGRRTVSSLNAGYSPALFWDGRALDEFVDPVTMAVVLPSGGALESQAVGPPVSDVEMADVGRVWTDVLARIGDSVPLALSPEIPAALRSWIDDRDYAELFEEAFGPPGITAPRVAMAIASYERTQFTDQTPFDNWIATGTGLTPEEEAGASVFSGAGRCDNCHDLGPPTFLLTDNNFRYTGVRPQSEEPGRMDVTGDPDDEGKVRTPSLRNAELRAPYMHNGRFATLEEVVEFYDRGGDFSGPNKDPNILPLGLTQVQKDNLLAFLGRPLTDPRLAVEAPPFDRPALYTESDRVPTLEGVGVKGSGGLVPAAVALEPPILGNPSFTVGVWNALGGADALLVIDDHDPGLTVPTSGSFAFESVVLGGSGAGAGFGSVSLVVPDDPGIDGKEWFGRWYVTDTGGGSAAAVSRLIRFRTFASTAGFGIFSDGFESGDTTAWSVALP